MFLDMNGTFMFGHDRLGDGQNFYPAYQAQGGNRFDRQFLNLAVRRVVHRLDVLYKSRSHDTKFPQVADIAREVLGGEVGEEEIGFVEETIASHEFGHVSDLSACTLKELSKHLRLIVVSNLWSRSEPWRNYLTDRLGESVLSGWVFSSDIGINKPAPEIFRQGLRLAKVDPSEVVMVGDDIERDIRPATELGMKTVWVSQARADNQFADHVISRIDQLL